MPELPEVETVRRGLAPVLDGARLARVEARRPDLRFALPDGFVQRLTGARIGTMSRRAKYLLAPLDRGDVLVMHLGMSGRFEIASAKSRQKPGEFHYAPSVDEKHAHVVFHTEHGETVTYFDPRRFGYMDLIPAEALADHPWFKPRWGPEPLGRGVQRGLSEGGARGAQTEHQGDPARPARSSRASATSTSARCCTASD